MKICAFICLLVCLNTVYAQNDSVLLLSGNRVVPAAIRDFSVDNLGNIYLLTTSNQVKKLNANGNSLAVYNDVKRYGSIYSIDATNPLKVLVYYKDFGTIVVLDRLLNARNTIELRKQQILQVRAVAPSYDNNIWLFDELDSKIKKIDSYGKIVFKSVDFRQVFDTVPAPSAIYDRDGFLYLYDANHGLYVFDYYGALKNTYKLLRYAEVQVLDKNTIVAKDSSRFVVLQPALLQMAAYRFPVVCSKMFIQNNLLYCLQPGKGLAIFSLKL